MPSAEAVRLRLAGVFTVERDGRPLDEHRLGSRKARVLLKVLAAARGHLVPMDSLVDILWTGDPPAKAEANVATLVSRVRAVLGTGVIDGGRTGYRVTPGTAVAIDVDEAEALVREAEARRASGQPALSLTAARAGLDLLGSGRVFEEEPAADWAVEVGRETARLVRRARSVGWRSSFALGDHRDALALAEDAVAADELDEDAHRSVILAYHRLGETGEALRAYERLRVVLAEQLGADPAPETAALYLAVLRGEPVPAEAVTDVAITAGSAPAAVAAASVAMPTVALDQPGFVGRERELERLIEAWSAASQGAAACVLVSGDAGIGTTRLASELATHARRTGGLVLQTRCYEAERSLFLQPIVEVVRAAVAGMPPELVRRAAGGRAGPLADLVPEVESLLGPVGDERASGEIQRRRVFEAVASFLGGLARQRPVLVSLDDLHHAGASTVELLHFALRWDRGAPLLVVATVQRNEGGEVFDHLAPLSSRLDLGPLAPGAVRTLARAAGLGDRADAVMGMTRGHTLFVVEALRALAEGDGRADASGQLRVPESLRSAVEARVHRCGQEVEDFLRAAVVAGSSFELGWVAELLSLTAEDAAGRAERARRAGILVEAGTGYELANDLVRDVLYDTTPAPTRLLRHRRLASVLADRPEAAAGHAAAAGDWAVAATRWLEAGNRALVTFASREAEQLFTSALRACALLDDPSLTARAHLGRGQAHAALGRYATAAEDLTAAQQLARAVGATSIEAAALVDLGWCAYYARDLPRANELAERAAAHPAAGPRGQVLRGRMRNTAGDLPGSIAVLEPLARGHADPATRASALSCLGTALTHSDRYQDATQVIDEALTACRHAGVLRGLLNARFFGCMARANLGDFGAALGWATELLTDVRRYDAATYRPRALNLLAWIWRELGDLPRAHDLAEEALERCEIASGQLEGEPAANALLALAESAIVGGDEVEAIRRLGQIEPLFSDRVGYRWRIELRRLELLVRMAPQPAEELVELARQRGSAKYEALGLGHLGRPEAAEAVARRTGSPLILARVAPEPVARRSFEALAAGLPADLQDGFATRGLLARQLADR